MHTHALAEKRDLLHYIALHNWDATEEKKKTCASEEAESKHRHEKA